MQYFFKMKNQGREERIRKPSTKFIESLDTLDIQKDKPNKILSHNNNQYIQNNNNNESNKKVKQNRKISEPNNTNIKN